MVYKKLISLILCFCLFVLPLCSCQTGGDGDKPREPQTQAKSYYEYFDTVSVIFSYKGDSPEEFEKNHTAVAELLGEYHKLFDIYYEYSGINNIKTINKSAGISPVKVDERLIDFLLYCKEAYTLTEGKTNIAMGSVLKLWHDRREAAEEDPSSAEIPTESELNEASLHCNIDNLIIDKEAGTVYISDPYMSLDVGAIGKGYATERAAQMLISRGVSSYVLNIGGNIRAIGEKVTGDGWVTGITNPDKFSGESFVRKVSIKNTSLVTSGDYERYYYVDGVKYHHVIDPVTLMPSAYFTSVSIFTLDSGLADALSTALFCMSYEDGLELVESIGGVEVIWVDTEYNVKHTDGIVFAD
ncbi:MAG: FAD:protein FMN transferase [Clostridia bacterium]|nr:FAD:protein FMN transferase [Clostridia bacterium]